MSSAERSLDDLRREVDEIDAGIHDLIMRRAELLRVAGSGKGEAQLRPARDAQVLRALVERHRGVFPKRVLVRIWREMMSALAGGRGPLAVAAFAPEDGPDLRRAARDHYGSAAPIAACESALSVLRQVTEHQAAVGVMPLPQDEDRDPWWRHLARDGAAVPRIVARLPFMAASSGPSELVDGLVIAIADYEPSGLDRSFLVVETGEQLSRSRLSSRLAAAGLKPVNILGWSEAAGPRLQLIEVEGFVGTGDARLAQLAELEPGEPLHIWAIGGYPVPLTPAQLADRPGGGKPGNSA